MGRKHRLNYLHRCNHRCKRRLMHEIDALVQTFSHTTVYAQLIITCIGPKLRMCEHIENTAITTHLMVISYDKCLIQCTQMLNYGVALQHTHL